LGAFFDDRTTPTHPTQPTVVLVLTTVGMRNRFHPVWGQITLTGYQSSRFAHQIERFACLYTSHVNNLINYSPNKSFRCKTEVRLPSSASVESSRASPLHRSREDEF
jgi:hypothetical protein